MACDDNRSSSAGHTRDLCVKMYDLQKEGAFCDMTLQIGGRSLQLHSVVLASCSETIAAELTRDAHGDTHGDTSCFSHLSALDADALERLVRFLYTGELFLDDETDVAALKLSCQCMGLWVGVELCDEYVRKKDHAAKLCIGEVCLTDVRNLAVTTDEPFDILTCRPTTNLFQESNRSITGAYPLKCHPFESGLAGLRMPRQVAGVCSSYAAHSDDRGASVKQSHPLDVTPLTLNNDNMGDSVKCHAKARSIGEETNIDINGCSLFEKDTHLATTNDLIMSVHRMTKRYIQIKGSQFSDVNCITRHSSKMLAPTNVGVDGVGCRRSGRTTQLPKRYSDDMAWGVSPGHVGVFGNQSDADMPQKDCTNTMEDFDIASQSSHEHLEERINCNRLQHHRRDAVRNKRAHENGKVSIISSEIKDVIIDTKMDVSNCEPNSRCIVGTDMKPTSSIQCTAMMRSTSTAQDSCIKSNLEVDCELSYNDANNTGDKCDTREAAECDTVSLSDVHKPGDNTGPSESKTPNLRYKHRKCGICKQTFSTPETLIAHRKLCHRRDRGPNPRKYDCEECAYVARTEKFLFIHMKDKHGVPLAAQDKFMVHTCHVSTLIYL